MTATKRHPFKFVVFSGAGISAESGIETFRGKTGIWAGADIDVVCNYQTWRQNFRAVHEFYDLRRDQLRDVAPNHAHERVVQWQKAYGAQIITQNIDDLFERAGATDVVHVHGNLLQMKCTNCHHLFEISGSFLPDGYCPACKNQKMVKPNVVFFGEQAPGYAPFNAALAGLGEDDVLVVIGTSGTVVPIGAITRRLTCKTILVNLEPSVVISPLDFDTFIYRKATIGVDEVDDMLARHRQQLEDTHADRP